MNPAWPRGSLFAVNRELPVTEASMPDRLTCSRINEEIHKLTLLRNGECRNDRAYLEMFLLLVVVTASAWTQTAGTSGEVENVFPQARALYVDVHQNPELSGHETQTAEKLVSRLRTLGYEVTEHIGGNGIVALLKNGPGPTVMLRTELDALPVEEKTGLPYASKIHTKDDAGHEVPVMHACGHDLHMASLMGTATIMANTKNTWHGTLMLIGQPAEETITGAKKMIDDGLFTRFPKPDVAEASGTQREPLIEHYEATDAVYNDPALAQRLKPVLESALGKENVAVAEPIMGSEDFSYFIAQGVPSFFFGLGGADPQKYAQAKAAGENLPSNHSSLFAPDLDPALHTGIAAEVAVLRNLLTGSAGELRKSTQQQSRSSQ